MSRHPRSSSPAWLAIGTAYLSGAIPWSYLGAKLTRGVDLRRVGQGTVSGTSLYRVAGFVPLAAVGCLEVAKGCLGPTLANGSESGCAKALAGGASVAGHNWSVFLGGAGGRGLSPAIGALLVEAPEGAALILASLALGRMVRETGLASLVAIVGLAPLLRRTRGSPGRNEALAVATPILAKRLSGNERPARRGVAPYLNRLLFDADDRDSRRR